MLLSPEKIKQLRSLKGYTLRKLAEKAEVHYTLIFYIEKGKRNLTGRVERKLLKAFGIDSRASLERMIALYIFLEAERKGGDDIE